MISSADAHSESADTHDPYGESILGRSLQEDEAVSINVYKPALTGEAREGASRRLLERIDKTAKKVQGVLKER